MNKLLERRSLFLILALGGLLRVVNLAARPLWYDEAFAMLYARLTPQAMLEGTLALTEGAAADVHPLFYYLSLKVWASLFGSTVLAARSLSLLYGLGTIAVVYLAAQAMFNRRLALLAALFCALSPFQIAYSQEARMYAQLGFWSTTTLWAFVRATQSRRRSYWLLFAVAGAATLYSHNLAFSFMLAIGLFVVLRLIAERLGSGEQRFPLRGFVASVLGMGVLFFPWLRLLPAQFGKVTQSYWVPLPSVVTFVQTAIVFGFWTDNQAASPLLAAAMLAGSLLILSLVAHQLLRGKKDWTSSLGLCLMVLLMPVVVLVLVSIFLKPVYIIRALMPSQIAFLILAAWMAVRLPRPIQIVSAGLLGLILAAAIAAHYRYQGFPRAPWDQVEAYLQQNAQPEDLVLHDNKLTYFPMAVLSPRLEQDYLPDLAGIGSDTLAPATQRVLGQLALEPDQPIAPHERIWFLIFERTREDYRQAGFVDDPYWLLLAENHAPQPPIRFADLELVLFVQEEGE